MGIQLRVLIVEDRDDETLMLLRALRCAGYDLTFDQVDTVDALEAALDRQTWDIIIADYALPKLNGLVILDLLRERGLDVPCIMLSGCRGEDIAVAAMKAGAHDYIMKHHLARLVPAVERELREAEVRRARQRAEAALQEDYEVLQAVFEGASDAIFVKIGSAHDITERKQTEEQFQRQGEVLSQSENLATMGRLLAGVAHELNNPLSVVMGQAALLRQSVQSKRQMERAEKIVQSAERCARIVRNFLALARQRPPERQSVSMNQVLQEAVELWAYSLRVDSVDVVWELAQEVPVLWADRHQLHQVAVNLVANAHQAMREVTGPRRLTVVTGVSATPNRVWMEVGDTGPGVAEGLEARIFEPFFTTKPPGVGTGLGLCLCQGIVEGHGGRISLVRKTGPGAVFRVELPLADSEETSVTVAPEVAMTGRGGRVLVVDDEPGIAGILAEVLQLDGHEVETVGNGEAALGKLALGGYQLILSDIRMPELDGPSLYREIERRDPRLLRRMIFLTGDTLSPGTREFLDSTGAPCLSKPFTLRDVRAIVQRVLQSQDHEDGGERR